MNNQNDKVTTTTMLKDDPELSSTKSTNTTTNSASISTRLISGSIGSIVTALTMTPLDVVKVRQQIASFTTTTTIKNKQSCPSCGTIVYIHNGLMECAICPTTIRPIITSCSSSSSKTTNRGIFATMQRIFVKEGLGGIYAGLGPTLVMSIPNTVLYFATYDEISSNLKQRLENNKKWCIPLVAGSGARLLASGITAPFELIRTRQAMNKNSNNMWTEMNRIIASSGKISSLYKGLAPTLWRDVPFSAIYWFHLEFLKQNLWTSNSTTDTTTTNVAVQSFVNGALSGMIAAACTTPFDVVKTRRQQRITSSDNTYNTMKRIVQTEGIQGLWRGNTTRMLRVAPACAIMISCYELGKIILQ